VVAGWGIRYHHASMHGLEPGTTYRYRVRDEMGAAAPTVARTAPAASEPFTFAAYGDQGTDVGADVVLRTLQAADPAFTLCLGDLCYADPSGGVANAGRVDHAAWDRWLTMLSRAGGAHAAALPIIGNHEIETGMGDSGYAGFLARCSTPGAPAPGLATMWAARWGNVGIVATDSNDVSTEITRNNGVSGGTQHAWLATTLAELRADPTLDWIVVAFHHSAYSTNTLHGSDAGVRRWTPLFDRFAVDLVLNGHNHCYERTFPLRDGEPVAEVPSGGTWCAARGTTYVCAGGGGGRTFPMSPLPRSTVTVDGGIRVPEAAPWSAFRYNHHSLVLVDVTPPDRAATTTMAIRVVDAASGVELDRVVLLRRHEFAAALDDPTQASRARGGEHEMGWLTAGGSCSGSATPAVAGLSAASAA